MKDVPENELFSAYLDGELTAEEQAEVDRLLAQSPSARQFMEELRAISASLQTLPTCQLREDLGEQVLSAAEKRMLREPAVPREMSRQTTSGSLSARELSPKSILRRMLTPRNLLWPAVAVAVAVVLTITQSNDRQEPAGRQIAATTKQARSSEKTPAIRPATTPTEEATSDAAETVESKTEIKEAKAVNSPRRTVVAKHTKHKGTAASAAARPKTEKPKRSLAARVKSGPAVGKDTDADKRVVVRCDVTRQAVEEGLLEKLLEKHGIVDKTSTEKPPSAGDGEDRPRTIRVTASGRKIKAVLDELRSKPTGFSSVSVEPEKTEFSNESSKGVVSSYGVTFELHITNPADGEE